MSGSRLALVADDLRLANTIGAHLKKQLGAPTVVCRYSSIRDVLGPDTDGVLVLAAASTVDAKQAFRLVQEISLQKWPPVILVLAGDEAVKTKELSCLAPYVAQQLHWPEDASLLPGLV